MSHTSGLLPLPQNAPALRAQLERVERELEHVPRGRSRRLLAIERRRTLIELDRRELGTDLIAGREDEGQ